jgi:selenide,water dikinase
MKRLNRDAARVLAAHGVRGCTDVTGFSLMGHGLELARRSVVGLRIDAEAVPLVPGTLEAAAAGAFPGGTKRNRAAFESSVIFAASVGEARRSIFFSPETSGGLLAAVSAGEATACLAALRAAGVEAAIIGTADPSVAPGTIRVA